MPFELPPWLTEPAHPFESLAKGAAIGVQMGKAFADNMYRNQALYVRARQEQQEQDLRVRELNQRDAQFELQSTVAKTKMAHESEDYNTLTKFVPMVASAHTLDQLNAITLPALHDTQNYLKVAAMLDLTKTEKAMGEMAGELAPTTNWADPSVKATIFKWMQKYPDISLKPATEHLLGRHEAAVVAERTAKRLEGEAAIRSDLAKSVGWEYPTDGSPPFLVDAKGATHFAPYHVGADGGFAPQKTTIGGVDLIQTSPNRWQVVNRPVPPGRMTDLEKANLSDIRKRRQAIVDALPKDTPSLGAFGMNSKAVDKYAKETNQISELTTKESELIQKIEGRDAKLPAIDSPVTIAPKATRQGVKTEDRAANAPPAAVAPKVRVIAPDGRAGFIPESQLDEALKNGYTRP